MATTAFTQAPCSPPPKVKKPPACPDCGALECLCRPRFFAGQLLSEKDLNRLDQYIKKKNQLHNRNLHGWGVVNGLKVLCDPCGQIKVSKGYAISPCGDDIVVCEDTAVDICALIRKCKQQDRGSIDCTPFSTPNNSGCDDLEEEWVLALKYAEFPSRGMTALRGAGCACGKPGGLCQCQGNGGCGCGKSSGCDCGDRDASSYRVKPGNSPAECEPTIVCEGYQFDVYRKQEQDVGGIGSTDNDDDDLAFNGALAEAFSCCVQELIGAISLPPGEANPDNINQNPAAWHQWCCRTRDGLIKYFSRNPGTNCELLRTLHTLVCPNPNNEGFAQQMAELADQLGWILVEGLFDCLCLALLPPAPEGSSDPRVPLATVKIRGKDCQIISVCNWTVCRKLVTTWPTMNYWLSIVPIGQILRNALDRLCCESFHFLDRRTSDFEPQQGLGSSLPGAVATNRSAVGNAASAVNVNAASAGGRINASHRLNPQFNLDRELGAVSNFVSATLTRTRTDQPLDPAALLNSISRFNLDTEQQPLANIESRNLPHFLLMNSLFKPLAQAGLNKAGKGTSVLDSLVREHAMSQQGDASIALHERVTELESMLAEQQQLLKSLQPVSAANRSETASLSDTVRSARAVSKKTAGKKAPAKKMTKNMAKKSAKKSDKKATKKTNRNASNKAKTKKVSGKKKGSQE